MRSFLVAFIAVALTALPGCGNAQAQPDLLASLQRMADSGNAEALYHIGMMYHTGSGVTEDHARALDAFRKAAALGDPLAAYKLGCYYAGQGEGIISADPTLALKYKLVAAEAGYALAQQDVAMIYGGLGETAKALVWLDRSAAQGWSDGLAAYASVYNGAPGVPRDPIKTDAYFRLFLDRVDASEKQRVWLTDFEARMSPDDRMKAAGIVRDYRAVPTALTVKALSGQRAAQTLATGAR